MVLDTRIEGDRLYEFVQRQLIPARAFDDGLRVGINWTAMNGSQTGVISGLHKNLADAHALLDRMLAE